jgi:hypothetical protein
MIFLKHNSVDVESALHCHFALLKGNALGEFYSISELHIHDIIAHFERFPDVTLVFGTTTYPKCKFGELAESPREEGKVYRVCYDWNEQQKRVIHELQRKHDREDYTMPFTDIVCNAGYFSQALLARKVGMATEVEDERLFSYLSGLLWANGMTGQLEVNSIHSSYPRFDERAVHNGLGVSNNVNGEWFLDGARPNPSAPIYDPLFDDQESTIVSRARLGDDAYNRLTRNALQRFIGIYGTLSYELAWKLIASGAIVYEPDRLGSELSEFEQSLLPFLDPADKTPVRRQVLVTYNIKTSLMGNDFNLRNDTAIEKAVENAARWGRCVKVKLGNKDTFAAIGKDAAIDAFVAIFGDNKRHMAIEFSAQ